MSRQELQAEIQTEKVKVMEELKKREPGPKPLPPVPMPKVVGVSDGEPPEPDVKEKRDKIREVRRPLQRLLPTTAGSRHPVSSSLFVTLVIVQSSL